MKKTIVALGLLLVPATAYATPQPLPFTYVYETLPKGSLEVEQYVDYTPIRVPSTAGNNGVIYGATQFQTEFEYGLTDRLELGLYATIAPLPSNSALENVPPLTEGTGLKERLRLRLAEAGEWPLDVGLYGELVENDHEFEIEAKIILQRRIGDLRIVANLWAEREYEYANFGNRPGDWVINPTAGITYQVTPMFHPGIEGWMRAEYPDSNPSPRPFNLGPVYYAGPTMMFDFGNFWWSTGAYFRLTDVNRPLSTGTNELPQAAPDAYGHIWIRMIIGLAF